MAGVDPELGEHLAQVPLHGARTEEESRTDLRVRQSIASEPRDLPLLRSQLIARLGGPRAHPLARGQQLTPGALGERLHPDGHEQLVCSAELLAGILAPTLAAQPLPVEQMRARELGPESRVPEAVDGLAVRTLGGLALAQQCARPGVDAERPIGVAGLRLLGESREGASCELGVLGPGGGLDQLAQRPRSDEELRRVLARLDGRRERLLVAAEAVHENGVRPVARTGRRSPGRWRPLP